MCLYMDNLNFHRSKKTKTLIDDLGMRVIYNPPYTPMGNCVEECFSVVKRVFKKMKLQNIMNKNEMTNEQMVEKAFIHVNSNLVRNCLNHSERLMDDLIANHGFF